MNFENHFSGDSRHVLLRQALSLALGLLTSDLRILLPLPSQNWDDNHTLCLTFLHGFRSGKALNSGPDVCLANTFHLSVLVHWKWKLKSKILVWKSPISQYYGCIQGNVAWLLLSSPLLLLIWDKVSLSDLISARGPPGSAFQVYLVCLVGWWSTVIAAIEC